MAADWKTIGKARGGKGGREGGRERRRQLFVTRQFNISPALRIFDSNFRALHILHRHSSMRPLWLRCIQHRRCSYQRAPLHHLKKVSSLFCINITSKSESTRRHRGKVSPRGGTALAPSISLEISHSRAAARRRVLPFTIQPLSQPITIYNPFYNPSSRRQLPLSYLLSIDRRLLLINRKSSNVLSFK